MQSLCRVTIKRAEGCTIYHVGGVLFNRVLTVTLHWFILTRFWHHLYPTEFLYLHLSMYNLHYLTTNLISFFKDAHAQNEFIKVTVLGAHVVLLARTWADWTGENLRGWKKFECCCAYMMRLFLAYWRFTRAFTVKVTTTSWQFPGVTEKRTHQPRQDQGIIWFSPRRVPYERSYELLRAWGFSLSVLA